MPEPVSITLIAAALGGAAGSITQTISQNGSIWLSEKLRGHQPAVLAAAQNNAQAMVDLLTTKVAALEERGEINDEMFNRAFSDPSFNRVLQKTLMGAAETNSQQKHELLAGIIAERLKASTDSIIGVSAGLVSDAIGNCTARQLKILGFCSNSQNFSPQIEARGEASAIEGGWVVGREQSIQILKRTFESRFSPYVDLKIGSVDSAHLEGLSCISVLRFGHKDIAAILGHNWKVGEYNLTIADLESFPVGQNFLRLWNGGADTMSPTSIGMMIGIMVGDRLVGGQTSMPQFTEG